MDDPILIFSFIFHNIKESEWKLNNSKNNNWIFLSKKFISVKISIKFQSTFFLLLLI